MLRLVAGALLMAGAPTLCPAAVTPAQAAALGGTLTPIGAERAGNAAGTIPPWTGGAATAATAASFAAEQPVLTIDAHDYARYAPQLPEGAQALFHQFADYSMRVFPTHRTAAFPQAVYDAVRRNATLAHPVDQGIRFGVAGAAGGIPFPIPASGAEVVWNHLLGFWGAAREAQVSTYVASGDGSIDRTATYTETTDFPYYAPGATPATIGRYYFKTRRLQQSPPARAGEGYIAWQPLNVATDPFVAWRYLPGEHRARRAPSFSYDTPDPDAEGYEALDDYYLFFGGPDRYVWTLLGKREMFIPYNNDSLALKTAAAAMRPHHANQQNLRFELHRVWVVEGVLASGQHHVAPRRRLYMDEDTWLAVYSEEWDENGKLWKFGHATMVSLPAIPTVIAASQFVYDLIQGGYAYDFVFSPPGHYIVTPMHAADTFEPQAMAEDSLH